MKALLVAINAKYIHTNPAVYSLQGYTRAKNPDYGEWIEVEEYTINHRKEQILASIYRKRPDFIGISCYIWNFQYVRELIGELGKVMPDVPIWLGGPEVSFHPEQLLETYPALTGIMIGEGEVTFLELFQHYQGIGKPLLQIEGLCYGEEQGNGSKSIVTTPERPLTDLSSIPFLYENLELFTNRILYYESSRGCPFRCSYCLSAIDKQVRLRDMELVKEELQYFLDHKVPQVKFIDRTFNCNYEHAMEIWQYLLEHDNGVTNFHFEVATELMREEEFQILNQMRAGLVQLEIGVQSTNLHTIQAIQRTMSLDRLAVAVKRIQASNNIHCHLDLIAGLPYEDMASFANSFNEVYGMKPEQLQLGFLKVLKGSYMEESAHDYSILYQSNPPYEVLSTKWISYEEILQLKEIEEMVELYYNTNQFVQTIRLLEEEYDTPFHMYEALAGFYRKKGYFTNQPSRLYRYDVLLEFARECIQTIGENEKRDVQYREALTYDLYERENLKSRPNFARDLVEEKEALRNFYVREVKERNVLPQCEVQDSKQLAKMTHIEAFECLYESKTYLLFDYTKRNPLTHGASVWNITKWV
ncbi:MAG: B12-binding domain-containing radical SAM protein [Eubacteriales bacterium]